MVTSEYFFQNKVMTCKHARGAISQRLNYYYFDAKIIIFKLHNSVIWGTRLMLHARVKKERPRGCAFQIYIDEKLIGKY